MPDLLSYLPSERDDVVKLEPPEIGWAIIKYTKENCKEEKFNLFNETNSIHASDPLLAQVISEGVAWLFSNGFLCEFPQNCSSTFHYKLTRLASQMSSKEEFESYRKGFLLPRELLHESIRDQVVINFLRGHSSTAVFEAFREVEIAVRKAGEFDNSKYGVELMRTAFNPESGVLTNKDVVNSERQAMSDLFAGSIGLYKNPHSHRKPDLDVEEAVEMVMLASHLLKIIETRTGSRGDLK